MRPEINTTEYKKFRLKDLKYKCEDQKKLVLSQKIDYIYNTSALEGNSFTYAETETLLSGKIINEFYFIAK